MAHPGIHATSRPDAPALIMAATGETVTWAELRRRSVAAANMLHDLGLRAGDPVAFCIENRPEFAVLVWACHDAGYRYTPISTRLTPDEVAYIVGDCGASVFLHSGRTTAAARKAAGLDGVEHVIDVDDHDALHSGDDVDADPRYERAEGIGMLYSSGTTGKPKGVWRPAPDEPVEDLGPADRAAATHSGSPPTRCTCHPRRSTTRRRSRS